MKNSHGEDFFQYAERAIAEATPGADSREYIESIQRAIAIAKKKRT